MAEVRAFSQDRTRRERLPASSVGRVGISSQRLSNLTKLYRVPIFALREMLEARTPGHSLESLRQADLVRKADETPSIAESDVDALYENYRYGDRLTFYLYLLPAGLHEPDLEELQSNLDETMAQARPCRLDECCLAHARECDACPHQLMLLDEEHWDGFREIRFRYYVAHRFLNAGEKPDEVLQSRYGFIWLDVKHGSLVILTRDEQVNGLLTRALSQCLHAAPVPVHFPKELLDKHFSIEKAKHLSYYDPGTGDHRCLSGHGLWRRFEQEVAARERQYARPSSVYDEEVGTGVVSGLGVVASQGKIYLTRILPTSVVRSWARQRLPELLRDVRELEAYQPQALGQPAESVQRMRLPVVGKEAVNTIVEALVRAQENDLTSVVLPRTALVIHAALDGRYFSPYLRAQCRECDESAEMCPRCEGQDFDLKDKAAICRRCGTVLSSEESVSLRCMNGHITTVPLTQAWGIAPNHWLQKRIARILADMGKSWDETNDYFHIEGNTLYRLRRGAAEASCLPAVVQNYISNFWDPVTGQVHAGGGDIIANGWSSQTTADGRAPMAVGAFRSVSQPPAGVLPVQNVTSGSIEALQPSQAGGTMLRREDMRPTVTYTPAFHGPIYGPTHAGSGDIRIHTMRYGMQAEDLTKLFQGLYKTVDEQAPVEKKQEAFQQVGLLKEAVQAAKPDVSRMETVLNWFKRNIPQLAGAITSVIIHPIVGSLVEAAGDVVVAEFKRRFGRRS